MKEVPVFHSARERIRFYFEDVETGPGRTTDLSIIGLIILSSIIYVIQSYPLAPKTLEVLHILDNSIIIVFTVEFFLRFWVAKDKFKHMSNAYTLIDLLAILPLYLGHGGWGFIRLFRVFRILRLVRYFKKRIFFFNVTNEDLQFGLTIIYTIFSILFISSGLIFYIENPVNPQSIGSFFDAFYYSVVTLTTVGFGDITPISNAGKTITIMMIVAGVVIIPLQISSFLRRMLEKTNKVYYRCKKCGLQYHEQDAHNCKRCGAKILHRK